MLPSLELPAVRELAKVPRWVCWRTCANRRTGKLTKVPFTPAGTLASSINPRTWSSYAECFAAAFVAGNHDGLGRVLVAGERWSEFDLDACLDPATGTFLHSGAAAIVLEIASYAELSPSRTGVHIWCRGAWPVDGTKRFGIEVYRARRFFTLTGDHLAGTPETHRARRPGTAVGAVAGTLEQCGSSRIAPRSSRCRCLVNLPETPAEVDLDHLVQRYPQLQRIVARSYPSESERDLAVVNSPSSAGERPPPHGACCSLCAPTARPSAPTTPHTPSTKCTSHDRRASRYCRRAAQEIPLQALSQSRARSRPPRNHPRSHASRRLARRRIR